MEISLCTYLCEKQDCHEKNGGNKPPHDLNVVPVWIKHRIFGKNVKVIVIDDGLETKHSDLVDNYVSKPVWRGTNIL